MAPALLKEIDLQDRVVTGDALLAQRHLCQPIVGQGGDYLFIVKANQATLLDDIATLFADPPSEPMVAEQRSRHGNRQEVRRIWTSTALNDYSQWPYLAQVCRIERQRMCKGQLQKEVAFAITSSKSLRLAASRG